MTEVITEYAQAIFELASEEKINDEILSDLREIKKLFDENPDYLEFLSSRSIPETERLEAIENAFRGKANDYVVNFLLLLCGKKHINEFGECVSEYEALVKFSENICAAKITSAIELSDDEKRALCSKLSGIIGKKVIPEYIIDESLLGVVVVNADGKVFDGSLKSRLKEIKEVINK